MLKAFSRFITNSPESVVLSVSGLFTGCFFILHGYLLLGVVIALCSAVSLAVCMCVLAFNKLRSSVIIVIALLIIFSPYANYAKEIDGVLYFGSAYGIDFQQYLAVLWSLTNQGLPFKNPYMFAELATYHYGYLVPLGALLQLMELKNIGFLEFSNYLFYYQIITSYIFLNFLSAYFIDNRRGNLVFIFFIAIVCTSYKWIYAGVKYATSIFSSLPVGSFDTPFGFKTPANDFLFGTHYVFSGIFVLYIYWFLLNRVSFARSARTYVSYVAVAASAFIVTSVNAFSIMVVAALYGARLIVGVIRTDQYISIARLGISTLPIPLLSYLGYLFFLAQSGGQHSAYFTLDAAAIPVLLLSFFVNFGPLIYLFIKGGNVRSIEWQMTAISVSMLLCIILVFRISSSIEADDAFNVSRRIGVSLGWLMIVAINFDVITKFGRWIVYPASLTFITQYYAFHVIDFNTNSRNERIEKNIVDSRVPYFFDKLGWRETNRVSFNFDIVVGHPSCSYPNSMAALRYSPWMAVEDKPSGKAEYGTDNCRTITSDHGTFKFGSLK